MSETEPIKPTQPKWMTWTGRVLSLLPSLLLAFSGVMKFSKETPEVTEGLKHVGWTAQQMPTLGVLELGSVVIYAIPQTAVLGAILLTGYMGGAIATHVRVGDPVYVHVVIGVVVWLGLFLRDPRLRALIPFRKI